MKKIFKVLGVVLLLLLAFLLIAGLFIKKDYQLERTISIHAPKEKIWEHIGSLAALSKWSPFIEADPNIQTSVEGVDGTVGAVYKWKGNKEVGAGTETITKVEKPDRLEVALHFIEPFEGDAAAYISQSDSGNGATTVAWGFHTRYNYPMNVMLLFVNMDKMMGEAYDKGLAKLKALSEAP